MLYEEDFTPQAEAWLCGMNPPSHGARIIPPSRFGIISKL
jgi:hypothetical protein